jgi:hypothetical protein
MSTLQHFDAQGYAIPWVADDPITECGIGDADYGDPAEWPAWTDEGRWEPTDDDYRPSFEGDVYQPTPEDLREMEAWFDRLDTLMDLAEQDAAADRRAAMQRIHAN